jgi:DNA-binding NtrC family response regulator
MYASILIAHHDRGIAEALASALHTRFPSVRMASSLQELEAAIPRYKAGIVVCDLETVDLGGVSKLAHEGQVCVICIHRVPDDEMWVAAVNAGAVDCCATSDPRSILTALERSSNAMSNAA